MRHPRAFGQRMEPISRRPWEESRDRVALLDFALALHFRVPLPPLAVPVHEFGLTFSKRTEAARSPAFVLFVSFVVTIPPAKEE